MAKSYNSKVHKVSAVQFSFDTLKEIYEFLNFNDVNYLVKSRTLSAIITDDDGVKLNVNKNDFVVRDENRKISIWKENEFNKEFVEI